MCGITGFIGFNKPIINENRLWEMTKILDHRGLMILVFILKTMLALGIQDYQ